MAMGRDINTSSIENEDEAWIIESIENAMPPPSSSARIHKVPEILAETNDYDKHYVPKVVSIGPYHHGKHKKFELVEKLKPAFAKGLFSKYNGSISRLYKKLGDPNMVRELRKFYEEKSTDNLSDKVFTRMMLLDGCFILYYIQFIYGEKAGNCRELKSHQIVFLHQDLFLLENQIPIKVLNEVMNLIKLDRLDKVESFFADNILARGREKSGCLGFGAYACSSQTDKKSGQESDGSFAFVGDHLLHCLHSVLTRKTDSNSSNSYRIGTENSRNPTGKTPKIPAVRREMDETSNMCTFRNVNELVDVGLNFKPSKVMSLAHVEFVGRWWWWSADVKLPPIIVDDSTKTMLLNLIAYEMCSDDAHDAWVTSYICLLDSLIDNPEDVKALRKAGVLDNSLGSDKEVAKLFNEIGTDLVPNDLAYLKAKNRIQRHYESLKNTRLSQLKHEYVKSPWSFLALLGAVMALFLSGVQTYYTIWSPTSECDNLCKFLKINHHL